MIVTIARRTYPPAVAVAASFSVALTACSSSARDGVVPTVPAPALRSVSLGTSDSQVLYVSDSGTNDVETFAWPKPSSPTGTLTGLSEPQGECADRSGDVFITNTGGENVLEFRGTTPRNTLNDSGQYPVGCSYDTRNGNLAVVNINGTNDGPGGIAIYKRAKGMPKILSGSGLQRAYSVQYDGSGDLFAVGETSASNAVLVELPAGSKKFKPVCPNGFKGGGKTIYPGGLGWDGTYLVIGDQSDGAVARVEVPGCKLIGTTVLERSSDIVGFAIVGGLLIGPDAGNADVEIYKYPKGGEPVQTLTGFSEPIGAAVSQNGKGE